MPARKIAAGYRGMRGSVKVLGASHAHESELERDFLVRMMIDRTLVAIRAQPITMRFDGPRGRTRHTPDYLTMHSGPPEGAWNYRLPPLGGELLSSCLARNAHDRCNPLTGS